MNDYQEYLSWQRASGYIDEAIEELKPCQEANDRDAAFILTMLNLFKVFTQTRASSVLTRQDSTL